MINKTDTCIDALLNHGFSEMLRLFNKDHNFFVKDIKPDLIEDQDYKTIMFTVSSSNFRLVVLLHYLPKSELTHALHETLNLDPSSSAQDYQDFVCELGNNFCGVICRTLGSAEYSTGMSTPALLANPKSIVNLRAVGLQYETHIGGLIDASAPLCASICLFFNKGYVGELNIPMPSQSDQQETLGELEFF